jgi:uncharacterized membrane protein
MTLLFLLVTLGLIWINLMGLALLCNGFARDYAVSRVGSVLILCLAFFFLEHFYGLGPDLWLFPFSTALSAWAIWKDRDVLRRNWALEAAFGAGVLLCLLWRFSFPNIDLFEERFPDFVFIHDYYSGTKLPPLDRWLPPFKADFYYSFQFYSTALMGRWFNLERGVSYQLGYCFLSGLIACSIYATIRRLSAWRPAAPLITAALLLGGCGIAIIAHLSIKPKNHILGVQMVRFLGMQWNKDDYTKLGTFLNGYLFRPGARPPPELPVEPISTLLLKGEFHPPLTGILVMFFSLLLIASLEGEHDRFKRRLMAALLAATIPLALVGNTWVFPLQTLLVIGWFIYRAIVGEKDHWLAGFFGGGAATALAYPFLSRFLTQATAHTTELRLVRPGDHANVWEWLAVFWPVVLLAILSLWNRERRSLCFFFIAMWGVLLALTEIFYNHDINGGTWERFNSTLKWWGWIYSGAVLTLAAINMGSRSRLCRYGAIVVVLIPCVEMYDYGSEMFYFPKPDRGHLDGTYWITKDYAIRDIVSALRTRPDGICIDSGNTTSNTDATVLAIYANKQAYVGWPVQEGIWREHRSEIGARIEEEKAFYSGKMADPLGWLLANDIRYVLWLQKDNDNMNARFLPLWNRIRSHYVWRHYGGNDGNWAVGFWERIDPPAALLETTADKG